MSRLIFFIGLFCLIAITNHCELSHDQQTEKANKKPLLNKTKAIDFNYGHKAGELN